ncbi:hypothetical protein HL658_24985 [Azospirillum sp. RWY-5-1]|uniref:Uncharacterized protein n=1 Tax=Azospirillum oleiclasticum TaxID=2735135 RepID=A0ABX2TCL4_9PROT|nr:hypothetical protein [Azospirillum oleiclasticum]NYZ15809.1 hypothetical protein [Azospirillum oleiclasticum]NYZ22079.1 hypothetical protein [Azospirillum oleiclasticum]
MEVFKIGEGFFRMQSSASGSARVPITPAPPDDAWSRDQAETPGRNGPSKAAIDRIDRLTAFDTTSRNTNLASIDHVRERLPGHGFLCRMTCDGSGAKANLLASLPADDGRLSGGLCLSGHVDPVPVDGLEWASDLGAPALVDDMVAHDIVPEGCIVGEPTMMRVVCAHKGANGERCRVGGPARDPAMASPSVVAPANRKEQRT